MKTITLPAAALAVLALPIAAGAQTHDPPAAAQVSPAERRPMTVAEARTLIGLSVRTADDRDAGTIHDFILSAPDGRIVSVVLAHGGILGLWPDLIEIPVERLRVTVPPDRAAVTGAKDLAAVIDLPGEAVSRAPVFTDDGARPTLSRERR